ncbi:hypothetical protein ACIQB5_34110 [Streptomyces sp. NPDC088560]|uniref:hypothetical protein n=1 Tax=Streptomyces sp. NPDC088560 TaxID=3365868 RepID=UPI0037FD8F05
MFVGPDIPLTEAPDACAAHHQPSEGRVTDYRPGESRPHSRADFAPGSRTVTIGRAG